MSAQDPDVVGLKRLRDRHEMATPGPWEAQDGNSHRRIGTRGRDGNVIRPAKYSHADPHWLTLDGDQIWPDLMLIVEMRNALPGLLDEIEALRAERDAANERSRERWFRNRELESALHVARATIRTLEDSDYRKGRNQS